MRRTLAVLVVTSGRPKIVSELVKSLSGQTRPPDQIIVVGAGAEDIRDVLIGPNVAALIGRRGCTKQRNDALAKAGGQYETLVFFDDDFAPSRFWLERVENLFAENPNLASLTGEVLADGNKSPGIEPVEARKIVAACDAAPTFDRTLDFAKRPYGCNMAFRASAIAGMTFDERLPLYAWQEDRDFGTRVLERGRYAKTPMLWGVHMGSKNGRVPGQRLGYSQIANIVYLVRKGTMTPHYALYIVARNLFANTTRYLKPEPWVDRRGRLRGNVLAFADALKGRLAPERILDL